MPPLPLAHALSFLLVTLLPLAGARGQADFPSGDELVSVRLLCDRAALVPGQDATLAVALDVTADWHVYAPFANDTGFPPRVQLTLPAGVTEGPIAWPVPRRHVSPGDLLDHVYEGEVLLLIPLHVAADATPDADARVAASVQWLVCDEVCLMGSGRATLALAVLAAPSQPATRAGGPAETATGSGAGAAAIAAARRRLPGPPPLALAAEWSAPSITLRLPGARALAFLPDAACLPLDDLLATASAEGPVLHLRRATHGPGGTRLAGVLVATDADGTPRHHRLDLVDPDAHEPPR